MLVRWCVGVRAGGSRYGPELFVLLLELLELLVDLSVQGLLDGIDLFFHSDCLHFELPQHFGAGLLGSRQGGDRAELGEVKGVGARSARNLASELRWGGRVRASVMMGGWGAVPLL